MVRCKAFGVGFDPSVDRMHDCKSWRETRIESDFDDGEIFRQLLPRTDFRLGIELGLVVPTPNCSRDL